MSSRWDGGSSPSQTLFQCPAVPANFGLFCEQTQLSRGSAEFPSFLCSSILCALLNVLPSNRILCHRFSPEWEKRKQLGVAGLSWQAATPFSRRLPRCRWSGASLAFSLALQSFSCPSFTPQTLQRRQAMIKTSFYFSGVRRVPRGYGPCM